MTPLSWTVMVVICGTVWGGFITLLVRALKFESQRTDPNSASEDR